MLSAVVAKVAEAVLSNGSMVRSVFPTPAAQEQAGLKPFRNQAAIVQTCERVQLLRIAPSPTT